MTLQDLKNNREQILNRMNELSVSETMTKEFMLVMVDAVNCEMYGCENPVELVDETFELNPSKWYGQKQPKEGLAEKMAAAHEGQYFDHLRKTWVNY